MNKKTIKDVDVKGKKVFVRVDYNVPFDANMNITNDTRMVRTLPTLNYLLDNGAALIIACHIGRPTEAREDKFSTKHLVKHLSELLKRDVKWASDCVGAEAEKAAKDLKPGEVLLLENLRYHKEEKKNDPTFAKQLASLADVAVDDAFGVSHRAHASNAGIPKYIETVAGFLMEKEINYIGKALEAPQHPFVAIIGGAKVSDKIGVISNMIEKVDTIIIGGGMAFTFLKSLGENIGNSLLEEELVEDARQILRKGRELGVKIYLPVDVVAAQTFSAESAVKYVPAQEIPSGWMGLDIGPASVRLFKEVIADAQTIWWNGPMGVFEMDKFSKGSIKMSHAIIDTHATTVVGGGDTADVVERAGDADEMTFISTGGGASLELIEGKELPGIKPLRKEE